MALVFPLLLASLRVVLLRFPTAERASRPFLGGRTPPSVRALLVQPSVLCSQVALHLGCRTWCRRDRRGVGVLKALGSLDLRLGVGWLRPCMVGV